MISAKRFGLFNASKRERLREKEPWWAVLTWVRLGTVILAAVSLTLSTIAMQRDFEPSPLSVLINDNEAFFSVIGVCTRARWSS